MRKHQSTVAKIIIVLLVVSLIVPAFYVFSPY